MYMFPVGKITGLKVIRKIISEKSSIDKYHYTVPWAGITGGAMAFTESQYRLVNGFSNEYWGWGCEDDDMFIRIVNSCLQLEQGKLYEYSISQHKRYS